MTLQPATTDTDSSGQTLAVCSAPLGLAYLDFKLIINIPPGLQLRSASEMRCSNCSNGYVSIAKST